MNLVTLGCWGYTGSKMLVSLCVCHSLIGCFLQATSSASTTQENIQYPVYREYPLASFPSTGSTSWDAVIICVRLCLPVLCWCVLLCHLDVFDRSVWCLFSAFLSPVGASVCLSERELFMWFGLLPSSSFDGDDARCFFQLRQTSAPTSTIRRPAITTTRPLDCTMSQTPR